MARRELDELASQLGLSASTLAQYADAAGSYKIKNSHSTPHKRTLPPRGSPEGLIMAQRIRNAAGTDHVRTLVAKPKKKSSTSTEALPGPTP